MNMCQKVLTLYKMFRRETTHDSQIKFSVEHFSSNLIFI